MTSETDSAIYQYVLSTGGTSPEQIQQWATQTGLNMSDVSMSFRTLLSTGAIYYYKKGVIVANRKKAPAGVAIVPQQQAPQQQQQQRPNPFGGSSNYRPPGVGRMRI